MIRERSLEEEIAELREEGYRKEVEEVVERVETDPDDGLTGKEAERRLDIFGLNKIEGKKIDVWRILLGKFKDPLILLLIAAAAISFLIGNIRDAIGISIAVLIVGFMGFFIEHKSEKTLEELKKLTSFEAKVLRDGEVVRIDSEGLVPGDILVLSQGDGISADARIIESDELCVDESSLTGESESVRKISDAMERESSVIDRTNSLFSGTIVTSGCGKAVVLGTGTDSEIGIITGIASEIEESTPLERDLRDLGGKISKLAIGICIVIFITGVIRGLDMLHLFTIAVSLAVAAIPEGLPVTTSITLSLGVRKMAKRKAIVRKLPSIETLGSVSRICSDKTGTLTENMMTVRRIVTVENEYDVTGKGSETEGEFLRGDGFREDLMEQGDLSLAVKVGALCNEANIREENGSLSFVGDPTEGALLVAARKAGFDLEELREEFVEVGKIPFSSERKLMISLRESDEGRTAFCKGAPSKVLEITSSLASGEKLSERAKNSIFQKVENLASRGMRVLALAKKDLEDPEKGLDGVGGGYEYVGLVAMIDPARKEVMKSVEKCKSAGIKVSMVTGDDKATAAAIADEVGILNDGEVITGDELDAMDDRELKEIIDEVSVFARTTPRQKLKILRVLKEQGKITAMTGDGVNDVPALKKADIGIAMGKCGSDAAREASDMVLTDDRFETITEAINYGRSVYQNIQKFLSFQLTTSIGAISTVSFATFLGLPIPLTPVQILWINVIMDGPPAISLGLEPPEPDVMERPPRDPGDDILSRKMMVWIGIMGGVMSIVTLFIFTESTGSQTLEKAKTMAFTTFAFFQVFNVFNCKSIDKYFWRTGTRNVYLLLSVLGVVLMQLAIVYLHPIQNIFGTVSLGVLDWLVVLGSAAVIIPANIVVLPLLNRYYS